MGFYGNISNDGKTNLTFDRIYPNRMTMDQNAEKDGVFIGRFVLVEYDDNTHTRRLGYKNPDELYNKLYHDSEYKIPYYLSADTKEGYGLQAGDLVYIVKEGHLIFYRATGEKYEFDNSAVFVPVAESNGDPNDYVMNYNTDKNYYNTFTNGWDSTVWQKSVLEGKETYRMIATLNSLIPRFGVVAEAPAEEPIAPHFGYENTNVDYVLHMPTSWGFRIKEAEDNELSDEFEVVNTTNTNGEPVNITRYQDIFYNKDGFEKEERHYKEKQENYVSLTPTGISGDNYVVHNDDGTVSIEAAPDIQEFAFHLPAIGNMASDFWDLMYSQERNTEVGWNSPDGLRFIRRDEETGNYIFDETKVESVAGAINSTQDLMGKIIRLGKEIEDADTSHIYFRTVPREDGLGTRSGFYIKELSNELISFDDLNTQYDLAFADYKEYIAGKNPQYLKQYNKGEYYIAVESGAEGLFNYYLETGESPTTDTKYYTIEEEDVEAIELIQWEPTTDEEWNETSEEDKIAYYYRTEEVIGSNTYYTYIKDTSEEPDLEKDYYDVNATRIYNLNFYNPEEYSEIGEDGEWAHKDTEQEVDGYPVYRGYFYYDDEQKALVPVYTDSNPKTFDPEEEYYIFSYTMVPATEESGKTTTIYKLNGTEDLDPEKDLIGNELFVQSFIDFNTQELYTSDATRSQYTRVKYKNEIVEGTIYYTLSPTLLNGYLTPEVEEGEEESEEVEEIDTQFYAPGIYYYKTIGGDFLVDRGARMSKDRQYYKFLEYPTGEVYTFYEPNKYYYYSVSLDGDKLDDSLTMRTAEDADVVVQQLEGREDFIYYLKRQAYVVADTSNHLNVGQVWNVNSDVIPEGVILGALFNDVVDELIAKGHNVEKKYVWCELKGFAKDLNTINGLILQLNKTYRFDDDLTRDLTTIKGTINTLKDYFAKFDILTPGYLLAVNEYGQLDSQNPGELTLEGYEVATAASTIDTDDTINEAFGKLEYKLNVLNADASTEGSVAHSIAEIVEVDGGAIDKLKEIANWIVDDEAGAAKIIADVESNKKAIETNLANYEADKIVINAAIEANTELINSNKEETDKAIAENKIAIESNDTDILTLQELVGNKSVESQIEEAIVAENLAQYALSADLDATEERVAALEDNVDDWNKAEANVQADWSEEDIDSDAYILNKPDLSDIVRAADLVDVVKTDTTFDYIQGETTTAMTISMLMEKIADLETRIILLENPVVEEETTEPTE